MITGVKGASIFAAMRARSASKPATWRRPRPIAVACIDISITAWPVSYHACAFGTPYFSCIGDADTARSTGAYCAHDWLL